MSECNRFHYEENLGTSRHYSLGTSYCPVNAASQVVSYQIKDMFTHLHWEFLVIIIDIYIYNIYNYLEPFVLSHLILIQTVECLSRI
jgi:hypothetical protein